MTPRWQAIAGDLRRRIGEGSFGAGGELGSEQQLCDRYRTSRITVRRALEQLRADGLVAAGRGRPWRVAGATAGSPVGLFRVTASAGPGAAADLRTTVLSFHVGQGPPEGFPLPVRGGPFLRVVELVDASGVPFDLTTVDVAPPFAARIARHEVDELPPARLLAAKGCEIGRTDQFVTAAPATAADAPLGVDPGAALLVVQRTVHDRAGRVVLCTRHRHPGERTRVEVTFPTTNQLDVSPVVVVREPGAGAPAGG